MFVCTVHVNSFDTSRSKVDLDWSVATALRWIASVLVIAKSQMFWSRNSHRLAFDRSCDSIPPELLDCTAFQFLVGVVTGRVLEIWVFFLCKRFVYICFLETESRAWNSIVLSVSSTVRHCTTLQKKDTWMWRKYCWNVARTWWPWKIRWNEFEGVFQNLHAIASKSLTSRISERWGDFERN